MSDVHVYDVREGHGSPSFHKQLGNITKLFLQKDGRLNIETDLAYEVNLFLSTEDMNALRVRFNEIEKAKQERAIKRKAT